MKTRLRLFVVYTISLALLTTSCRKEESEFIEAQPEQSLEASSNVASLLKRTAMNDGSNDNIVDNSSCFNIELPVTVAVNGLEIIVDDEEDFNTIEAIFDEFDDDDDSLQIMFPITIVLNDFTEVTINSFEAFEDFSDDCGGENEIDDDIECADIEYPVIASVFNSSNELIETINILNDKDLYDFVDDLDDDDIVNISFPITIILSDGTQMEASNLDELENIIDDAKDDCDEDDDNDFNDDDCENCTTNQLSDVLLGCSNWIVDKLERNDNDLEDQYSGYQFNFMADGTLSASTSSDSFSGTWESSGTGNSISVVINIPNLSDFNASWTLHEIEQSTNDTDVDLRMGGSDRLRFESSCSDNGGTGSGNGTTGALATSLTEGQWEVGSYMEDADDQTANYSGYAITFNSDGSVVADNGVVINGTWAVQNSENELVMDFGNIMPFDDFNDTWDVISITDTQVELQDVSGGNGGSDTLILIKQ
jgi:hypothetical protein